MLIVLSFLWGYSWVVVKVGMRYAGPFDFGALRVVLGALSLFAFLKLAGRPLKPHTWKPALILGLAQTSAFVGLTTWALVTGSAGKTSVLVFTMPFWTLLFAWPVLGERIRGAQWIAVILALAGLMLIIEPWRASGSMTANICGVLGGVAWAASAVYVKWYRSSNEVELLNLTAWQLALGSIPLVLLAWIVPSPPIQWTAEFIASIVFIAILATALGWIMWMYVLNALPAGAAGMSTLAIPVIAVISAWIQLGERPPPLELNGMLLIVAALAILTWLGVRYRLQNNPAMAQE